MKTVPFPIVAAPFALALAACSAEDAGTGNSGIDNAIAATEPSSRQCASPGVTRVSLTGGSFAMGATGIYPEEGPVRTVTVGGFAIDSHEVTNAQFAAFVKATGHVTIAEKPVDPAAFNVPVEQIPAMMLKAGSAVFKQPRFASNNYADWWEYVPGASWQKPYGPDGPNAVAAQPVVHLAYDDMAAYARWAGGRLPTEAEWEYAARAGAQATGEQPVEANSWQGVFPVNNAATDGFAAIAPVGCFKPNDWGLYDMVGNVWEMTSDFYAPGHDPQRSPDNPVGPVEDAAYDPGNPGFNSRVVKGGSYLCAPNYCRRYRPAARTARDPGLGASNVGFRLVYAAQETAAIE